MDERIYDYWVATLQDGYIGSLTAIVSNAGGARAFYEQSFDKPSKVEGVSDRLADYIKSRKKDINVIEDEYMKLSDAGISYVNHTDDVFPEKLLTIPSPPYGLFVKGALPDPDAPTVSIVGARQCSEYGRLMAEFLGSRLAKCNVQTVSGMAWGIDGISQAAALSAGGRSFAVMGCGVDIVYPAKNRTLYEKLCEDQNGIISEYAPRTSAVPRLFPPRNRIISGLCDVLIVVEARSRSGTLITVDMAIDQGKTVMVVPGRLTDSLSAGCLNLLYQGALPVTGIDSVLELLKIKGKPKIKESEKKAPVCDDDANGMMLPKELKMISQLLSLDPQSAETVAKLANIPADSALILLSKLEIAGKAREIWPGYFIKNVTVS